VIGGPPEHREYYDGKKSTKPVRIYRGARIFDLVTINAGTVRETVIGAYSAVFNKSHIAHDCILHAYSTVGGQSSLAGHTILMDGATLSGMSCTHQYSVIGAYAFVGGGSFVTKDIPPGEKWVGRPARFTSYNDIGLERAGMDLKDCLTLYKKRFEQYVGEKSV